MFICKVVKLFILKPHVFITTSSVSKFTYKIINYNISLLSLNGLHPQKQEYYTFIILLYLITNIKMIS